MALNAPIGLSGEDRQKCSFTVPAKATNLNRYGAAIQLNRELLVGSIVVVRNKSGTQVSARVVAQLAALQGVPTYAIEFAAQDDDDQAKAFWGITFPSWKAEELPRRQRSSLEPSAAGGAAHLCKTDPTSARSLAFRYCSMADAISP